MRLYNLCVFAIYYVNIYIIYAFWRYTAYIMESGGGFIKALCHRDI